jgi:MoxR-like ATPase
MIDGLLTAVVAGGHILLEGVPGLAKTLAVKSLAEITGLGFKRVQFTPDLLPADLTGTLVWEPGTGSFSVRHGPIFANIVLADEINRAPAKVQSALLEAMEEYQVTIGDTTWELPEPFLVLATQNPIEHEGTYPLPEAELDRFMLKLKVNYPKLDEEISILDTNATFAHKAKGDSVPRLDVVLGLSRIKSLKETAAGIHVDPKISRYIVDIVTATRPARVQDAFIAGRPAETAAKAGKEGIYRYIAFGASPRGSIALYRCARITALFAGRAFVTPDDVKKAAPAVLRHRIVLSYEAEADGLDADTIIAKLLSLTPVP